ncbi:M23 family metallopeptidase [Streptomyces odonnellii]|uniref:M23 family metallopeptidase n=1 Tax=Streptomyces odonnellii TaxID=1417980 RepID=UPI00062541B4|nr:M23 family metallopeptidase [Streptomyces odonnellii]
MNDQHAHAGYAGYDGYQNGSFATDPLFGSLPGGYEGTPAHNGPYEQQYDTGGQWDSAAQQQSAGYDAYATPQYESQYGQYDASGQWADPTAGGTGYQQSADYQPLADIPVQSAGPDATGQWDADAWNQANQLNGTGHAGQFENAPLGSAPFDNSQFDNGQFENAPYGYDALGQPVAAPFDPAQGAQFETAPFDAEQFAAAPIGYEPTAQWIAPTFDSGAYDATAWNSAGTAPDPAQDTLLVDADVAGAPDQYGHQYAADGAYDAQEQYAADPADPYGAAPYDPDAEYGAPGPEPEPGAEGAEAGFDAESGHEAEDGADADDAPGTGSGDFGSEADSLHMAPTMTVPAVTVTPRPVRRSGGGNGSRGRRRTPAKRSALLTVAVPSACVMGVAGIAAASVGGLGEEAPEETRTTATAADPSTVKPVAANNKLDTQLAALSADARDFGDRASRTQERIDLKARQEAERKQREADAARKEALRPKFALPVAAHGLSAYYGQAGINWMSVHTGIDFPVSYGTPVMAATDGTVRTQYNSAYGNMAIVTSPDGTETWYCHLSSTKIRYGTVKAGDVIAYSGNSGNSTGPHLHFEVRPGGGSAIDPLSWLRSHGLDPT